ncbi:ABC transporter permease [Flavihumibacter profundi]|uniref:ABC transporter permease n=1 Tax=Flavihumibacter profundi TaxID=2716883 RepID=UPI001CC7678D|nr:ABC transporter permease [Flavihumibacter profundi]MBZ5855827.1 ABC transporter permease [Flavihumibacter profundi]
MFRLYTKIAWRNLVRNKIYSVINVAGLALGITAFLLILEYVSFEKSYNNFHKNLRNIYRLINEDVKGVTWPQVEPGWAMKAKESLPEITSYCRFEEGTAKGIVRADGENTEPFRESDIGYAEGNFFEFFDFNLLKGQAAALKAPNTVFISQKTATKYFGNTDPIDKVMTLSNQFGEAKYSVKGIFNIPENSDIRYEMVFSLETLKNPANLNGNNWAALDNLGSQYINTYFQLSPNTDYKILEKKLTNLRNQLKQDKDGVVFRLQPFANVHLPASLSDTYQTTGNLKYVYILTTIAFLILLIAWFNYINLSTANSLKRANEVGVRKIVGATQGSLVMQFLGESILVNILGFSLALVLVTLIQPVFNQVMKKEITLATLTRTSDWIRGFALLVVGSLLSGIYTAYTLSNFNPVETLKNKLTKTTKGGYLRKTLVVSQFAISIALVLATILIYQQLQYMQNKNLGMNANQMLVIRGPEIGRDSTYKQRKSSFLNQVQSESFVQDFTASGTYPGGWYNFNTSGFTQPGSKSGDELKSYAFAIIDNRYLDAYQIKLKAGRNFTEAECAVEWNDNSKVMLNERAAAELGFMSAEEAVNKKIKWDERALEVVGVVKDYHHTSLQRAIDPMIFYPQNNSTYMAVRLGTQHMKQDIDRLETLYKLSFSGNPFEYFFMDENFNKQYATEQQYGQLFTAAAVWAIFIACLGLFGLTTFSVESRTKEIGIRKVLGASITDITRLLSGDFLKLVIIAAVIAFPLAWFGIQSWLQDFAYRVSIEWWVFIIAGAAAMLIAFATISIQAIKAAMSNPVKNLRTE